LSLFHYHATERTVCWQQSGVVSMVISWRYVSYFHLDPNYVLPSLLLYGTSFSISFPVVTIQEKRLEESFIYCFSSLC